MLFNMCQKVNQIILKKEDEKKSSKDEINFGDVSLINKENEEDEN